MKKVHIETIIYKDIETVWEHWNNPSSITSWAFASDDWESTHAENDLRAQGRFLTRMSAKDGSVSFDFTGTYTEVIPYEKIAYLMDKEEGKDIQREVIVIFTKTEDGNTKIEEDFDPEDINSEEMQQAGWQAILENFKKYVTVQ